MTGRARASIHTQQMPCSSQDNDGRAAGAPPSHLHRRGGDRARRRLVCISVGTDSRNDDGAGAICVSLDARLEGAKKNRSPADENSCPVVSAPAGAKAACAVHVGMPATAYGTGHWYSERLHATRTSPCWRRGSGGRRARRTLIVRVGEAFGSRFLYLHRVRSEEL